MGRRASIDNLLKADVDQGYAIAQMTYQHWHMQFWFPWLKVNFKNYRTRLADGLISTSFNNFYIHVNFTAVFLYLLIGCFFEALH